MLTVLAGPARSGKTAYLLDKYRSALREGPLGSSLWLAPTNRAAREIRGRLMDESLRGCFAPGVVTFSQFAESVLRRAPQVVRPITPFFKRLLLRWILREMTAAGRIEYFAPASETTGLASQLSAWLSEIKRLEIWPDELRKGVARLDDSPRHRELLDIYEEYQRRLTEGCLYDAEGRLWSARTMLAEGKDRLANPLSLVVVDGFSDFTRTQHEIIEILLNRSEQIYVSLPADSEVSSVSSNIATDIASLDKGGQTGIDRSARNSGKAGDYRQSELFSQDEQEVNEPRGSLPRVDLFAKPHATLRQLHSRHQNSIEVKTRSRRAVPADSLSHLERHLFSDPAVEVPSCDGGQISILQASNQLGEVRMVMRKVKQLLLTGDPTTSQAISPADIAVVFRTLDRAAPLVREVCEDMGIPCSIEQRPSLLHCPAVKAIIQFLTLDQEDWQYRRLLAVLGSNYLEPELGKNVSTSSAKLSARRLVRELQIVKGRSELLSTVQRFLIPRERESDGASIAEYEESRQTSQYRRMATTAWPLLERLATAYDDLPGEAAADVWAKSLQEFCNRAGLLAAAQRVVAGDGTVFQCEADSLARLFGTLASTERLSQWLNRDARKLSRSEVTALLTDLARTESLVENAGFTGRVNVLSAASARALEIPYLFVAGLSELDFPASSQQGQIYSDRERARLIQAGLPFVNRPDRSREEMLLFYEVVTRAVRRLYLSYPSLDEKAQPLSPSPYLEEVERVFGNRLHRETQLDLRPVAQSETPWSEGQYRVDSVHAALNGDFENLARLANCQDQQAVFQSIIAGLNTVDARQDRHVFSQFEGIINGAIAKAELASRYGRDRVWSPSELEDFAACPFRFLIQHVIGLQAVPDLELATDYLTRGRLLHNVLAEFHRRVNSRLGGRGSPSGLAGSEAWMVFVQSVENVIGNEGITSRLHAAHIELEKRLLLKYGREYLAQHRDYDSAWQDMEEPLLPAYFEVAFGASRVDGREEMDLRSTVPLEISAGSEMVRIGGRIDRIDVGRRDGQLVFSIVDYKSGSPRRYNKKSIDDGTALQLPLYAMAAEELFFRHEGGLPHSAGYWFLKEKGFSIKAAREMFQSPSEQRTGPGDWETTRKAAIETVRSLVRSVQGGEFPVFSRDDNCTSTCELKTICRINHIRAMEKEWQPTNSSTN